MKYFALSAALAISADASSNIAEINKCSQQVEGKSAEDYINNVLIGAVGQNNTKNYNVRYRAYNGGASTFVTIACKYADWQDNGHPYSPYEDGRIWNRTKAELYYLKWKDDRDALKILNEKNGGTETWPAKWGGRYRCGNKMVNGENVMAWRQLRTIPDCPDRDTIGATVDAVDPKGRCYKDSNDRDLKNNRWFWNQDTTQDAVEACKNHCKGLNYYYAGVQNSNECWCDNEFGKHGTATNCNMKCEDMNKNTTNAKICGGEWANSVYLSGYRKGN